jgi:hypothetical protein
MLIVHLVRLVAPPGQRKYGLMVDLDFRILMCMCVCVCPAGITRITYTSSIYRKMAKVVKLIRKVPRLCIGTNATRCFRDWHRELFSVCCVVSFT